jgi:hypothetical protein
MWTYVSEEIITSIFRVEIHALLIFDSGDGDDAFFQNVGSHTDYTVFIPEDSNIHNYHCEELKSYSCLLS